MTNMTYVCSYVKDSFSLNKGHTCSGQFKSSTKMHDNRLILYFLIRRHSTINFETNKDSYS